MTSSAGILDRNCSIATPEDGASSSTRVDSSTSRGRCASSRACVHSPGTAMPRAGRGRLGASSVSGQLSCRANLAVRFVLCNEHTFNRHVPVPVSARFLELALDRAHERGRRAAHVGQERAVVNRPLVAYRALGSRSWVRSHSPSSASTAPPWIATSAGSQPTPRRSSRTERATPTDAAPREKEAHNVKLARWQGRTRRHMTAKWR